MNWLLDAVGVISISLKFIVPIKQMVWFISWLLSYMGNTIKLLVCKIRQHRLLILLISLWEYFLRKIDSFNYFQLANLRHLHFFRHSNSNKRIIIFSFLKINVTSILFLFLSPQFSNSFKPPIDVDTRSRSAGDFSAAILKLCHKLTIGEITKRIEVAVPNLASLPAHETLKLVLLKNNFFMETQRSFKRFFIIDEITSFGKVFL